MKSNTPGPKEKICEPKSERKQQGFLSVLKTRQTTTPRKQGTPFEETTIFPH